MIRLFFTTCLFVTAGCLFAQNKPPVFQLSSHILDINKGLPAPYVPVILEKYDGKVWHFVDKQLTDDNGRIKNFLPLSADNPNRGIYKLRFMVASYFQKDKVDTFYPFVEVVFQIQDDKHYHVPITLSPYGYTTYRGN